VGKRVRKRQRQRQRQRTRGQRLRGSQLIRSSTCLSVCKGVRRAKSSLQSDTEFLIFTLNFPAEFGFVGTEAVCFGWDCMRVFLRVVYIYPGHIHAIHLSPSRNACVIVESDWADESLARYLSIYPTPSHITTSSRMLYCLRHLSPLYAYLFPFYLDSFPLPPHTPFADHSPNPLAPQSPLLSSLIPPSLTHYPLYPPFNSPLSLSLRSLTPYLLTLPYPLPTYPSPNRTATLAPARTSTSPLPAHPLLTHPSAHLPLSNPKNAHLPPFPPTSNPPKHLTHSPTNPPPSSSSNLGVYLIPHSFSKRIPLRPINYF